MSDPAVIFVYVRSAKRKEEHRGCGNPHPTHPRGCGNPHPPGRTPTKPNPQTALPGSPAWRSGAGIRSVGYGRGMRDVAPLPSSSGEATMELEGTEDWLTTEAAPDGTARRR